MRKSPKPARLQPETHPVPRAQTDLVESGPDTVVTGRGNSGNQEGCSELSSLESGSSAVLVTFQELLT